MEKSEIRNQHRASSSSRRKYRETKKKGGGRTGIRCLERLPVREERPEDDRNHEGFIPNPTYYRSASPRTSHYHHHRHRRRITTTTNTTPAPAPAPTPPAPQSSPRIVSQHHHQHTTQSHTPKSNSKVSLVPPHTHEKKREKTHEKWSPSPAARRASPATPVAIVGGGNSHP